jgi:hypothetical protein
VLPQHRALLRDWQQGAAQLSGAIAHRPFDPSVAYTAAVSAS